MTMPGEHVTNAVSARYNANLLERINATPGPVAAPVVAMPMQSGPDLSNLSIEVHLSTDKRFASAIVRSGIQEVARTDKAVLREAVR